MIAAAAVCLMLKVVNLLDFCCYAIVDVGNGLCWVAAGVGGWEYDFCCVAVGVGNMIAICCQYDCCCCCYWC